MLRRRTSKGWSSGSSFRSPAVVPAVLGAAVATAFVGCGDTSRFSSPPPPGACGTALSKFQECGFATSGVLRHDVPSGDITACMMDCFAKADCAELGQFLCASPSNLIGGLAACMNDCTTFPCGDGSRVDLRYRCDGTPNCPDGSDEAGCPQFTCTDGTVLPGSVHCNYVTDCSDNSDEAGCPAYTCASGQKVPPAARCDGITQCTDFTDETGCPAYTCASGQQVIGTARCDGPAQCADKSDEANCPPEPSAVCNGQSDQVSKFFGGTGCY